MGDVEHPHPVAHRAVLGEYRRVLDWHLPTPEVDEPGAEGLVDVVKR
jgi:hypothetical protein